MKNRRKRHTRLVQVGEIKKEVKSGIGARKDGNQSKTGGEEEKGECLTMYH